MTTPPGNAASSAGTPVSSVLAHSPNTDSRQTATFSYILEDRSDNQMDTSKCGILSCSTSLDRMHYNRLGRSTVNPCTQMQPPGPIFPHQYPLTSPAPTPLSNYLPLAAYPYDVFSTQRSFKTPNLDQTVSRKTLRVS
ncbi:hypothetical protein FGIG_10276 [Fasciola gigantica]|uniref:Uncharacterized protein n=1 Tax=Fasciola gigantica TaxID=46835 RepID=A0A504Z223_FASGI|nr:hypothetical protein FGIG_10276 [Fasciola gigantica]